MHLQKQLKKLLPLSRKTKVQGMQQSKIEIAKKMLSKGMSLDLAVEMTGLSEEEIKTL